MAKNVAEFLLENSYIFDKNSEFYLTDAQVRKIVNEKMMSNAYKKIDFKSYILDFKYKIAKKI